MAATTAIVFFGSGHPNEASFTPSGTHLRLVEGSSAAWVLTTAAGENVHRVSHPELIVSAGAELVGEQSPHHNCALIVTLPGSTVESKEADVLHLFEGSTLTAPVTGGLVHTQWGSTILP